MDFQAAVLTIQLSCHYVQCEQMVPDSPDHGPSLVAQLVKNPPGMQETLVRILGQEDPREKG